MFSEKNNNIKQELANLNNVLARLEETIVQEVSDLISTLVGVKRDLSDNNAKQTNELAKVEEKLKTNENSFNDQLTVLESKTKSDINQWQIDNQKAVVKAQQDTAKQIEKEQIALNNVKDTLKMIEEAKNETDTALIVQKDLLSLVYQNTFNKASGIGAILLLYFLFIALAIYVKGLANGPHRNQGRNLHHIKGVQDEITHSRVAVIPNANLANAVCVISFDKDTQNHYHRLLMTTVIEGLTGQLKNTLQVHYHVIRQNDEIRNIPPAKLYVIFADFSERHVSIEQRGIGLGDLKRTTYEKVCSLGGALMMVYVRDPGSRKLAPYRRYNADIDCIQSQQELNDVNAIGRFFSVFETFTEFQLQCARNIIAETIEN